MEVRGWHDRDSVGEEPVMYDEKCYELAEYFLPKGSPQDLAGIAQAIQDAIEANLPEVPEEPA